MITLTRDSILSRPTSLTKAQGVNGVQIGSTPILVCIQMLTSCVIVLNICPGKGSKLRQTVIFVHNMKTQERFKTTMKRTALIQTTEDYAGRSSIHGIGYVFDRDLNLVDRLFWLLVVLALLMTAAMFSLNFWSQWRDEQVIKGHHMFLFATI